MPDRSPLSQAVNALLISAAVLAVTLLASWLANRVDDALGHGPLPSGIPPFNAFLLTLISGGLAFLAGGVMLLGARQAKYVSRQFAWLVYVIVALPLLALMFVPLQRFGADSFMSFPAFFVGVPGRMVVAASLGALLVGSLNLRRVAPGIAQESFRSTPSVSSTGVRGLPGRFTPNGWRAIAFMQEEAKRFEHGYMGTEHLLLGLLRDVRSQASRVLVNLGAEPSGLKSQLEGIIGRRGSLYTGGTGMTRRCQRVIESAARIARKSGQRTVGTGHLLHALVEQPEDVAGQLLEGSGITADRVAAELRHMGPEGE